MKAPTADYSSLSQALSSKNSALQTSYSAKDASNWKSSYDIQQKSFELSKKSLDLSDKSLDLSNRSLDLQEEQTNVNGIINMTNAAVNLVEKSVGLYTAIKEAKQDDITQTLTQSSTAMANEWQTQLQMNSDYMTDTIDPVTGGATIALTEKGQKAYDALMEKYFPSDTKYGWGMDDTATQLKESLRVSCLTYAQSQGLQNIQTNADTVFTYNYEDALEADLTSGNIESIEVSDGAGGTKSLPLGTQSKALIDSRPYMTDDWRTAMYEKASADLISKRGTAIISDITQGYGDGTYINDAEARAALDTTIEAHLDTITDPTARTEAEKSIETAITSGIKTYFTNLQTSIIESDTDSYTSLKNLYETALVKKKGTDGKWTTGYYYSLFFDENDEPNPYITDGTYTTIMSSGTAKLKEIEDTAGTTFTSQVNKEFTELNNKYTSGQINATEYGSGVETIMSVYNDQTVDENGNVVITNWRVGSRASEAWEVYKAQLKTAMPEELSSNPMLAAKLDALFGTLFEGDDTSYNKLTGEQEARAASIKQDATDQLTALLMGDPSLWKDTNALYNKMDYILSQYTKEWMDFTNSSVTKVTAGQALTGTEVTGPFGDLMEQMTDEWSAEIEPYISADGTYDRSHGEPVMGVNDSLNNAITNLGTALNAEGAGITDTRAGSIKFKLNDDGTLYRDDDGNLEVESIVWSGVTNGTDTDVVYNLKKKKWSNGVSTGDTSGATNADLEQKEYEDAEATLLGGQQIEAIDGFLEDNAKPMYSDTISFLQDNCVIEEELDATLTIFYNRYKEGKFMPGESFDYYEDYMNSIVDTVVSSKGWSYNPNRVVTTRATVGNSTDTAPKTYREIDDTERAEQEAAQKAHRDAFKTSTTSEAQPAVEQTADTEETIEETTEKKETSTDAFKAAQTYATEHSRASAGDVYQYLKGFKDQSEFEDARQGLIYEVQNSNFLRSKVDDPEAVINGYADDIRKKNGWTAPQTDNSEYSSISFTEYLGGKDTVTEAEMSKFIEGSADPDKAVKEIKQAVYNGLRVNQTFNTSLNDYLTKKLAEVKKERKGN